MYLTWLDSNSWLIEMGNKRILLDPWLVGNLVFGNMPWLFQGMRSQPRPIPEVIDLILLSQGLEDHAHPDTLKQLDRSIPVVASPNAAKVVQELGYSQITSLAHGESYMLTDSVTIQAFPGSPIGPFLTENAYLLREASSGQTLYYEPHGYHAEAVRAIAPVDVVITPMVSLEVPLLGAIIQGHKTALQVAQWLRPQVMLPTAAGGDISFTGFLNSVLRGSGSIADLRTQLAENGLTTQVIEPKPGDRLEISLENRVSV
ncbi:MBL fold metallo-hydrolase [Oscillatoria sp. FACHB-1407]|uniref:MBL fold metallo-hydrolase n=1 Tax=Oscillatoria sp. FACHB-1407 TaxID=2692847 RepID=UPI00168755DD|nr:MBL fold metallo-hydrolase [Oscillatoria sp. FACHB-1407]MBD2460671.1 MBL fold metallo-hydrolase [Oscillatoria sp. FACHB-1407]